jgi:hypothetical protein
LTSGQILQLTQGIPGIAHQEASLFCRPSHFLGHFTRLFGNLTAAFLGIAEALGVFAGLLGILTKMLVSSP